MPASSTNSFIADPLLPVMEIMRRHGVTCTPEQFHAAVNVTFHNFEAEEYDALHRDMWESVPPQIELLIQDCAPVFRDRDKLTVLDIGCGTGLASDSVLRSSLGPKIGSVDLLDTSTVMLGHAKERSRTWGVPVQSFEGIIESLPTDKQYDLIITCSVLHHVPDLLSFLKNVQRLQRKDGVFIHLQDPNGDSLNDPALRRRTAEASKQVIPEWAVRFAPSRVFGRLMREVTGKQNQDYLAKTNRELLNKNVITTALSIAEMFQITDIHVQDHTGVSIERMSAWMPDYELLSRRSYSFFGQLWGNLPPRLKREEEKLIAARALNGEHVGASWKLMHN
jgi:2-polyprenyl-3-methyl-5-hydroxy-6-metoxy-1,4-benzoquinol methylase